jgi:opacity protein-like surface antigen
MLKDSRSTFSFRIGLFALLCLAHTSKAADLPSKKEPLVAPPSAFTWTGLYIGFNFGHTWTGSSPISAASANVLDLSLIPGVSGPWGAASALGASGVVNARLNGFLSGGQLGYNWQFTEKLVAGLEADIQGAGVRGGGGFVNVTPAAAPPGAFAATSATLKRSLDYFGTVRGRIGYAVTPNILVYATGGLAYAGVNESATIKQSLTPSLLIPDGAKGDVFENRVGWTIGGGFEWAFTRNLSAKLEYLYYDLGSITLTNATVSPLGFNGVLGEVRIADATSVSTRFNGHLLRAGLNYRFDWSEPQTSGSAATPLFASPEFVSAERLTFGEWRIWVMPYMWAININGDMTAHNHTIGTDVTIIDVITKSSSMPLAFMGRIEARNGPVSFYGDLAWVQLRFSGSTLKLRSPLADLALGLSASDRLKATIAIGEAGGAYEVARWKQSDAASSFTALDAYAGLRYWFVGLDLSLDLVGAANAQHLDLDQIGGRAIAKSGGIQWIDPIVGLRLRHEFAPGQEFQMRGDIGGFGVGSKFSWEFYGGYSHDFEFAGLNLTGTIGYRALSVDYSRFTNGRQNGINAILHGPVTGVSLRF